MVYLKKIGGFKEMSFWSKVKETYTKIDTAVGGYLPGGVTPSQVKATSTSSTPISSTPTSSTPTSSTSTSSGGGTYTKIDTAVGGYLPGGVTPTEVKAMSTPTTQQTVRLSPGQVNITESQIKGEAPFKMDYSTRQQGVSYNITDVYGGGIITSGTPLVQELGAPVITQQEAEKYNITSSDPVYILSSKDPDEMAREFSYASDLPYTSRAIQTKDLQISNLASIRTGQELYRRGSAGETDINIDAVYAGGVKQAKLSYAQKPRGERFKLYALGAGQGVAGVGIHTAELPISLTSSFLAGKSVNFQFGGGVGEVANYPIVKGARLGSPAIHATVGAIGTGGVGFISRARTVGMYTAGAETVSFFSPVRMSNRMYGGRVPPGTKFTNIKVVKYTAPGDVPITTRVYYGSSGGTRLYGVERSGKTGGAGQVITKTPFTEVKGGGAIVESGMATRIQPYIFKSTGGGIGYGVKPTEFYNIRSVGEYPGGISRTLTAKGITIYERPTRIDILTSDKGYLQSTGGISRPDTTFIKSFASGGAKPTYETKRFGGGFIYSPTSTYKISPRLSGKEIDLNKLFGGSTLRNYFTSTGGFKTRSFKSKPAIITKPSVKIPKVRGKGGGAKQTIIQTQKNIVTSSTIASPKVSTSSSMKSLGRSKTEYVFAPAMARMFSRFRYGTSVKSLPTTTTAPAYNLRQSIIPRASQTSKLGIPASTVGGAGFSSYRPPVPPRTTIIRIPLFSFGGFGGGLGARAITGGKRRTGFVPSFSALAFKIKGAYKKGKVLGQSGLDFRPITPGFKFKTGLRTKIKVPKIL